MGVLSSFCGLLTLQVGAAVLAIIFFTLAGVILAANIFDYHNTTDGWPINLVLMIFFVIGLILIGVFMFASSYSENRRFAIISVVGIVILLCYWIILCCFSFFSIPAHVRAVCIANVRCPESLWIASLGYRGPNTTTWSNWTRPRQKRYDKAALFLTEYEAPVGIELQLADQQHHNVTWKDSTNEETAVKRHKRYTKEEVASYSFRNSPPLLEVQKFIEIHILPLDGATRIKTMTDSEGYKSENNYSDYNKMYFTHHDSPVFKMFLRLNETQPDEDEQLATITYGFPFIGAIILFVANLLFLIFAALIMWSWASELDWADYYIEDEPVIVYEEN